MRLMTISVMMPASGDCRIERAASETVSRMLPEEKELSTVAKTPRDRPSTAMVSASRMSCSLRDTSSRTWASLPVAIWPSMVPSRSAV